MRVKLLLLGLGVLLLCGLAASRMTHYPLYRKAGCEGPRNYQCTSGFNPNIRCRAYRRPRCSVQDHRSCDQGLTLLRKIWVRLRSWRYRVCCHVINCPRILYSKCSFKQDQCPESTKCRPRRYRRHYIYAVCRRGWRWWRVRVIRYLPYCCTCRECPGDGDE